MVACVCPVGIHSAEILNLELNEGFGELGRVAEFHGEGVCAQGQPRIDRTMRSGYIPAWNSKVLLRIFIKSFTTVSIGAKASENRRKPMMIGNSVWKPNDS